MNAKHLGLFEELTPPAGGAERFAQRLDELTASPVAAPARVQVMGVAACLTLMVLAAGMWLRQPESPPPQLAADSPPALDVYGAPEFDRLLGRAPRSSELTVTLGTDVATVTQLETMNDNVRIYLIN